MRIKVAVLLLALLGGCDNPAPDQKGFAGLGNQAAAFKPVVPGRVFSFPADHGPHDGFRIEWWYVTANLKDPQGNEFGAQWTLFRSALNAVPEQAGWANPIIWLGHAAVTSATAHYAAERYARGGVGQAGVNLTPFSAWIDDWHFSSQASADNPLADMQLNARDKAFNYQLRLTSARPLDSAWRVEKRWNTRIGSSVLSTVTAEPNTIRSVLPAIAASTTSGAEMAKSAR